MCVSEATIELMLNLPSQVSADTYSLLMRDNSLETGTALQLDPAVSGYTISAPQLHLENVAIAA